MTNIPAPPPPTTPPDEKALAYLDCAGDAVAEQVATARVQGQKVPAALFLPPPPRSYDHQLIRSFIAYLFANTYTGETVPEIRFTTSNDPAKIH